MSLEICSCSLKYVTGFQKNIIDVGIVGVSSIITENWDCHDVPTLSLIVAPPKVVDLAVCGNDNPADTRRNDNVIVTSKRRPNVVLT